LESWHRLRLLCQFKARDDGEDRQTP
jgi:hypothetical protein